MPRRPRAPKAPPVPVVYEESAAIRAVADRLIRLFPARFGWTSNFKLGYVIVRGSKPKSDRRFDAMAKFKKVPPVYNGLTGFDAVVEVQAWSWDGGHGYAALTAEQQEALVAHELCHGSMSEKGALRVERHDLEEFRFVVREWGAWQQDIRAFDEQLAMFDARGATVRTPKGEQTTLETPVEKAQRRITDVVTTVVEQALDQAPCPARGCTLAADHAGGHEYEPTPIRKRSNGQQPPAPLS